ncbi:MAG: polysaccharide deacetylase family protein [Patescibacteria group bacterium]
MRGKKILSWALGNPLATMIGLRFNHARPLVLLYHGVTDQPPTAIEKYHGKHIPAENFRRQITWLKQHFTIVPLAEVEALVLAGVSAKKPLAAITFDDGYQNNFRCAFPILRAANVTATFFLTGDFVDRRQPLWPDQLAYLCGDDIVAYARRRQELKTGSGKKITGKKSELILGANCTPLTWEEIKIMAGAGMSFGAHTLTHPILSRLTESEQAREILESKKLIESKLGRCPHFAYPNGQPGDWNEATLKILREAGWRTAWTTIPHRLRPGQEQPFLLPRVTIAAYHDDYRFRTLATIL